MEEAEEAEEAEEEGKFRRVLFETDRNYLLLCYLQQKLPQKKR